MTSPGTDGRRIRAAATRRRLLDAGAALFAARGYAGTTLDAIAQSAGANRALVRYHFGGKQGLFSAILREAIALGAQLCDPVRASDAAPADRLGAFVDAVGELGTRCPHFMPMIVLEQMSGGQHIEPEVFAEFGSFFLLDRQILEQGMQCGAFRAVDPHATHLSLVGALVFFHLSEPLREQRRSEMPAPAPSRSAYVEHVKELFRLGLARSPERDTQTPPSN